jgi:hypothetical protein
MTWQVSQKTFGSSRSLHICKLIEKKKKTIYFFSYYEHYFHYVSFVNLFIHVAMVVHSTILPHSSLSFSFNIQFPSQTSKYLTILRMNYNSESHIIIAELETNIEDGK